jgi:type I restriction enzyme, S subunit
MTLNLISLTEQREIAPVPYIADREIFLLQQKLDAIRSQKKGLMQKPLTGQIRVN